MVREVDQLPTLFSLFLLQRQSREICLPAAHLTRRSCELRRVVVANSSTTAFQTNRMRLIELRIVWKRHWERIGENLTKEKDTLNRWDTATVTVTVYTMEIHIVSYSNTTLVYRRVNFSLQIPLSSPIAYYSLFFPLVYMHISF